MKKVYSKEAWGGALKCSLTFRMSSCMKSGIDTLLVGADEVDATGGLVGGSGRSPERPAESGEEESEAAYE